MATCRRCNAEAYGRILCGECSREVDRVAQALAEYMRVRSERDTAKDACERSWGYFGSNEERRLDEATVELDDALREYVKRIVAP